jgi:geranylgeranyl diphosphate synthase type II
MTSTTTKFDFQKYAATRRALVEQTLTNYLATPTNAFEPGILWDAMRYSVLSGGKRLRALLALAAFEAASGIEVDTCENANQLGIQSKSFQLDKQLEPTLPLACAIEFVHAMSLIHDDLPCMDNDDFRRGKPTNHKVYGEAIALLAGDALLMHAVQILIDEAGKSQTNDRLLKVVAELSRAAGAPGMVGGQVIDISLTGNASTKDKQTAKAHLEAMHSRKTGALISFCSWAGAALAGADEKQLAAFRRFGEILGLAFQITDDLLDVTGDITTLGKTPGKDAKSNKLTFIGLIGIDESKQELARLEKAALDELQLTGISDHRLAALQAILQYSINRIS